MKYLAAFLIFAIAEARNSGKVVVHLPDEKVDDQTSLEFFKSSIPATVGIPLFLLCACIWIQVLRCRKRVHPAAPNDEKVTP